MDFMQNNLEYIGRLMLANMCMITNLYLSVGHIQISQVPDRHEPSDDGTINFTSFFEKVKEIGYDGWVAGEYHAAGEKLVTIMHLSI